MAGAPPVVSGLAYILTQKIPRLASQQPDYLGASLKRFCAGTGERIDPMMAAYTRNLKDPEIANLAAYLTSMRP